MTIAEANYLPAACRACLLMQPKGKVARAKYQETFMQGVLAAATAAGWMTSQRADMIAFLCAVGRLDEFVNTQAALP